MTPRHPTPIAQARRESGAALVVGLILLLVLTLLAISGMTTASLELQMAGNEQYQKRAFEASDAGIEQAMTAGVYNTNVTVGAYDNPAPASRSPTATRPTARPMPSSASTSCASTSSRGRPWCRAAGIRSGRGSRRTTS
jgi:type IV pilus assembly protein PilX